MALLLNHFNFRRDRGTVLLTNDAGEFLFLDEPDFATLVRDPSALRPEVRAELEARLFLSGAHREVFASTTAARVAEQKGYLQSGPSLHIFVLTRRCNQRCVYCQVRAGLGTGAQPDMAPETAERAVEVALQSPAPALSFEFQGGEPTLNFATLRHLVEYAEARRGPRPIRYAVVTNLAAVDDAMLGYFAERGIGISTSLDGPAALHMRNRPFLDGGSFAALERNIARARAAGCQSLGAIQTTTRASLGQARAIVDTYVRLGFTSIFLRPLTPLGSAQAHWARIGYTTEEYLAFYREALAYVLELARRGVAIQERHALLLLRKIFRRPGNYMELRSPCGAAIGQLAYNYDGGIYPCDEGRMLAEMGKPAFRLGDVGTSSLREILGSPATRALCVASCLELLPGCGQCVYQPYCGACPVVSYAQTGSLFSRKPGDYRCTIYRGMLDTLFGYLRSDDARDRAILKGWAA